jgi:hypothetical protein
MSFRHRVRFGAGFVIALLMAVIFVSAQGKPAPGDRVGPAPSDRVRSGLDLVAPVVISGNDFGFRVESIKDNIAVGTIVVRINGRWTDAQLSKHGLDTE